MPAPVTTEAIKKEIERYWKVCTNKQADAQADFYAENSLVITSKTKRVEPGRLVAVRRRRDYLESRAKISYQLREIDVMLISPDIGVAAYIIDFRAEDMQAPGAVKGKVVEEHMDGGRVTQVFVQQRNGMLKIVHEHISNATQ